MSEPIELKGFSQACYDRSTVEGLIDALRRDHADAADCKQWGISEDQWRGAIADALYMRILWRDRLCEEGEDDDGA